MATTFCLQCPRAAHALCSDRFLKFGKKRAPFNGMRGKRAPFIGMRGKREEEEAFQNIKNVKMVWKNVNM